MPQLKTFNYNTCSRVIIDIVDTVVDCRAKQGRYDIYQVIADMLSIMIDNTTKKSNLSTILISIKTPVCNKMFVDQCSLFGATLCQHRRANCSTTVILSKQSCVKSKPSRFLRYHFKLLVKTTMPSPATTFTMLTPHCLQQPHCAKTTE